LCSSQITAHRIREWAPDANLKGVGETGLASSLP
jgi:hypothetical protein